jgi:hypothetical protein
MVKYIKQLANDMMKSFELNAMVNNMRAKDVKTAMEQITKAREDVIREAFGGNEELALELNAIGPTKLLPVTVCGTASNLLCQIFLDDSETDYLFDFNNRADEAGYCEGPMLLFNALKKRSDEKSYVLRIDCTSHSYVLYLPPSADDAYLMQANCADCMKAFTLQEWMNGWKGDRKLSLQEHYKLLWKIRDMKEVALGPPKEALVTTFSIDNDKKTKYEAYKPGNMTAIFRSFDEATAIANMRSLYQRAGRKKPF